MAQHTFFWILSALLVLSGCAAKIENRPQDLRLVTPAGTAAEINQPPFFLIAEWQQPYNHIGAVQAEHNGGVERIYINPDQAVVYYGRFSFTGKGGKIYSNQVFRVHFPKIPFSLVPFHLGTGANVGILVVITRDNKDQPVLVTTANTCGCYVSIIPTSFLPVEAYPPDWPEKIQRVYGEVLPAQLQITASDLPLLITIRPAVHRVMDVEFVNTEALPPARRVKARIEPLASLKSLPLANGRTTSMYYETWPLRGHVKGALKPWESLLLSLVSLDLYVGMDKEFGSTKESGNPFYTSLKPWNRKSSDMNYFNRFLHFHGWNL